ncbi:Bug family tripartite tricarboxylate transporter substrate binding protein [Ramlibacter rhizophilus]|uniref:Tripartite tricarboxylate transporter substrate binding protein n=1 Tax=Ramlibacter rhizophilus TaxID=1781167 RepID=A0A4Z0BSF6_9BURK|nr:tripartite tricarboxylate transporter substrate binding protein [Ramlibacter rhizophilus]TFZ01662.1 tripartite tricarboxylate transporter substrate binding protein [Ramlibacter rhizophilus]
MPIPRRRALANLAGLGALAAFGPALAQGAAYPSKQINLVVSYPAGGDTDALARLYAEKLAARFNQPVVVENRPGASGTIGNAYVAKAAPDGYTLLFTPNTISIATLVIKAGPSGPAYDAVNDFTPIIQAGSQSLFLVVNTATGVTSVKELVEAAKAGKIRSYASPGSGSPMHILGETFNKAAGVQIAQVPYRGSAPAIVDLVGGHIPFMYTTLGPVAQHIASGKLAAIGVADAKRSPLMPNVPTLAEAGYPDVLVGAWQGLMGPKGLPQNVVRTLNTAMNDIIKMPDVIPRMTTMALVPVGGEPAVLGRANAEDHKRYSKLIQEFGIRAE